MEFKQKKTVLLPTVFALDPDLAYELIGFSPKLAVEKAYDLGRKGSFVDKNLEKTRLLAKGGKIPLDYSLNEVKIIEVIKENYGEFEVPAKNAGLVISGGEAQISPEQKGIAIDYKMAFDRLRANVETLNSATFELQAVESLPEITAKDLEEKNVQANAREIIELAPIEIAANGKKWKIDKSLLEKWISAKILPGYCTENRLEILGLAATSSEAEAVSVSCPADSPDSIFIGLDEKAATDYLKEKIASQVDIEPQNSKFEMRGGKVTKFQVGRQGEILDPYESFMRIEYALAVKKSNSVDLPLKKVEADIDSIDQANDLGIKEIAGTGQSNFSGSPGNRRHNIRTGANKLHGMLIKPDEEFSLVRALGSIEASTGYLPELVIKDNRTIPEYGGGLCQIGTTMFRAALATGLPITARTNHSYRVSYYEPAGTDATIYDPAPDFKFVNDTGNYILIQSRIEGNNLYFDFWGAKDGRKVVQTKPTIYNLVKPGPTKIIETTSLKPGEKKCTENAHTGADAYFDYTVTYADGAVKEKRFSSHYRPWQAVCLVGVAKIEVNKSSTASTTPAN